MTENLYTNIYTYRKPSFWNSDTSLSRKFRPYGTGPCVIGRDYVTFWMDVKAWLRLELHYLFF